MKVWGRENILEINPSGLRATASNTFNHGFGELTILHREGPISTAHGLLVVVRSNVLRIADVRKAINPKPWRAAKIGIDSGFQSTYSLNAQLITLSHDPT